ncbi:uncharacterized protein LAJ45_07400 [Morchella importuna]|uniref:NADH dehydrogenase [ubiquinone] iron-sulfur protein 5 n=1 Tax=Morchella conica CCBAS932 TaxID=1392247 RepID=A0A3N4L2V8_9PEZI|nr:uncharacterized protein LAJ45_07400 [Morchella importuna]KAH8148689.1 hypothetical protein LAJ45_07400 [Morchella importuna]RPB14941.1 hypothetical protein P167DRAFT_603608 [Morchella conica CCBAS932]
MASGYGLHGGVGRCFPFWQDMLACYVMNTNSGSDEGKWKCAPQHDDYYECLHHKKELAKAKAIQSAYIRRAKTDPDFASGARPEGETDVKSLGLLGSK